MLSASARLGVTIFVLCFWSPISLVLSAEEAASVEGTVFQRSRSGTADWDEDGDGDEAPEDLDLGLDPVDAKGLAWRDQNRAMAELEAESTHAWASTTATWA